MSSGESILLENTLDYFSDPELEISLSQIKVGCIPYVFGNENFLLFKEETINLDVLAQYNTIKIDFDHIERPEFPTISASIKINTSRNLNIKYEYFFLTESEIELNYLKLLIGNRVMKIYFIEDEKIRCKADVVISDNEINKLSDILNRLNN